MNIHKKTALIHMIHAWTSLSINFLISTVIYAFSTGKVSCYFVISACVVGVLTIGDIVSRILYQLQVNDTSNTAQLFRYLCVLLYSCMLVYITYIRISHFTALIVVIAIIVEIVIAIMIPF